MTAHDTMSGENYPLARDLLRPPQRSCLGNRVADIIRRYMYEADLQHGDRLPSERALTRRLSVSHRVVRDALKELEVEGAILRQQGSGTFVQDFDRSLWAERHGGNVSLETDELLEARLALECGIMPLVTQRATEKELLYLDDILQREKERYTKGQTPVVEDIEFHMQLLHLSGNRILQRVGTIITATMRENVYRTPALLAHAHSHDDFAMQTHAEILNALRGRDTEGAIQAVIRHLRRLENA